MIDRTNSDGSQRLTWERSFDEHSEAVAYEKIHIGAADTYTTIIWSRTVQKWIVHVDTPYPVLRTL